VALWDPGGKLPRERTLELKGPVETINVTAGIDAPQQKCCTRHRCPQENPWLYRSGVSLSVPPQGANHTPFSLFYHSKLLLLRSPPTFVSRPIQRVLSQALQSRDIATRTLQSGHLVAVTPVSHCCHTCPCNARTGALAEETQCMATNC